MKCVVVKNDGIGDLILASGFFEGLYKLSGEPVDLVTCTENSALAPRLPGVGKIYYISRDGIKLREPVFLKNTERPFAFGPDKDVLQQLRETSYDMAVVPRRFIRQSTLVLMNSINATKKHCCWQIPTNATQRQAVSFSEGWNRFDGPRTIRSELEYYWAFGKDIDPEFDTLQPHIQGIPRPDSKRGINGVVAVGISGLSSRVPESFWLKMLHHLSQKKWQVHLFGGEDKSELATRICKEIPNVKNLVARLSFSQLCDELQKYGYYIGNDTGLTHLATLAIPRVLVLMGGGTFERFFPWPRTPWQHTVFYGMDCFDCGWRCAKNSRECVEAFRAENIVDIFNQMASDKNVPSEINLGKKDFTVKWAWQEGSGRKEVPLRGRIKELIKAHPLGRAFYKHGSRIKKKLTR